MIEGKSMLSIHLQHRFFSLFRFVLESLSFKRMSSLLLGFLLSIVYISPAAQAADWLEVGGQAQVNVSNPIRSRRSPDALVKFTITNTGSENLIGPLRLVIAGLTPTTVTLAEETGTTAAGEVYVDLDTAYIAAPIAPGETSEEFQLTFVGGGSTTFSFTDRLEQQPVFVDLVIDRPTQPDNYSDLNLIYYDTPLRLDFPEVDKVLNLAGDPASALTNFKEDDPCSDSFCLFPIEAPRLYVTADFWYQSGLIDDYQGGGDEVIHYLEYLDGIYEVESLDRLKGATTLISWALKDKMDDLMSCASLNASLDIPERYQSQNTDKLDVDKLRNDLTSFFWPTDNRTSHIAIGAFEKPSINNSITRGVTYSNVLDVIMGPFYLPIFGKTYLHRNESNYTKYELPQILQSSATNSTLIAINTNVHEDADFELNIWAGVIFHEILHNFGFDHEEYKDRKRAILALQDCMCNVVSDKIKSGTYPSSYTNFSGNTVNAAIWPYGLYDVTTRCN